MEMVGGIVAESSLIKIKSEDPDENDANIVEIRAEDIQDEIKKEIAETINLKDSGVNNIVETGIKDIRDDGVQKVDKRGQIKDRKESDPATVEHVQEKLILNAVNWDLDNDKQYRDLPESKNKLLNITNHKPYDAQYDQIVKVNPTEYSLKDKKYRCNHCQALDTSKKKIAKHIRINHRHLVAFQGKEEKLKHLVNTIKSKYIAWYEYTPEDHGQYLCSHCQVLFQGEQQVKRHIRENHRASKQGLWKQCPHCPYRTKSNLTQHTISVHTEEKDVEHFRCDQCDFKSKLKPSLRRHIINLHMNSHQVFKCPQCPQVVRRRESLLWHIKTIHTRNPGEKLKCHHCPYDSVSKTSLKRHVLTHMYPDTVYNCPHCDFATKNKQHHYRHIQRFHGKTLLCHVCSYTTKCINTLRLHLITHKKVKEDADFKFRCNKCHYKAYRQYSLQIHKLNHLKPEEVEYFYCYHCDFKAKRKDNLKTHISRHFQRFQCVICEFTARTKGELALHTDKHSKEQREEEDTQ